MIEELEEVLLLTYPQLEPEVTHRFAPGVYLREIFMPAGSFIIGHQHNTEHFNIVLFGEAEVLMGNESKLVGPGTFVSKAGVRKVLFVRQDMRWITVHPTIETDIHKLEAELITKSAAYLKHEASARKGLE
jgi:hypothetical protein